MNFNPSYSKASLAREARVQAYQWQSPGGQELNTAAMHALALQLRGFKRPPAPRPRRQREELVECTAGRVHDILKNTEKREHACVFPSVVFRVAGDTKIARIKGRIGPPASPTTCAPQAQAALAEIECRRPPQRSGGQRGLWWLTRHKKWRRLELPGRLG